MTSSSEYEGGELEAMRPSDSSWHPCKVYSSTFGICLSINFGSCQPEDMVVTEVEALQRLRFRSTTLTGDDCHRINLGEHLLVAHQSPTENVHCDAIVKKVLRVRHSKRNNCNCTFVIEFLEKKGENINVTSDSVRRLHNKNVKLHPVVCEFLKAVKSLGESTASPSLKADCVTDDNENLNGVFKEHIKESYGTDDVLKNNITRMPVLGLKANEKAPLQRRLLDAFNLTDGHVQVSGDRDYPKIKLQKADISQSDVDTEDTVPSISELPKNRFRLSPLGARAALASLVSTIHAPMVNDAELLSPSVLINPSIVNCEVSKLSSNSKFSYSHSATEVKLPEPGNSGRLTRSVAHKVSRFPVDDSSNAIDVKTSRLVCSRRFTRPSGFEQHVVIGDKGSGVTDLVQPKVIKSVTMKESNSFHVENDIDGYSLSELTCEVHCAPLSVASDFVQSKSSMACAGLKYNVPVATRRVTRSAARAEKNSENCADALLTEYSAVSHRCTRSGLRRSASTLDRDQGPEDCNLVKNTKQTSGIKYASQRKEKLPLEDDCKTYQASDKIREHKTNGIDTRGQGETASSSIQNPNQKRKAAGLSTSAVERRFSPRLRHLS